MAQVHVHLAEAGAAIEAGARARPAEPDPGHRAAAGAGRGRAERTVLSVVAGPGLAEAVARLGGTPVLAADREQAWSS